tara:strand:- start:592 stop:819 length:228 start_codon:yes stop_codon:yes gene_type:complete
MDEYRCKAEIKLLATQKLKHVEENIVASDERQARSMFSTSLRWKYNKKNILITEVTKISNPHRKRLEGGDEYAGL